jgi:hypothetical protein
VPIRFCEETFLGSNFNVKIYVKDETDNEYDLWYQGRIEDKSNDVRGVNEKITIRGNGYQSQLKDIYIDQDYTSEEASQVIDDIMTNHVEPNTDITYTYSGNVEATSFTFDSLEVNKDSLDAIQTVSDVVGTREWGVDANRNFYFKARSTSVGFRFPIDDKVIQWNNDSTSKDIVNRVVIIGGEVSGSPYTRIVNKAKSQNKWGRRDRVVQNSSIVTSTVADQFAEAIFSEFDDITRRAKVKVVDKQLIESTIPIPLASIIGKQVTYGSKKYGEMLYSGRINYQVNRVTYQIDRLGNLIVGMEVGQLRPDISEKISQLQYRIDQLANTGV